MKHLSKISAFILSAVLLSTGFRVNAIDNEAIDAERQFVGFTFNDSVAAVVFDSWSDYRKYSTDAREIMKNDTNDCYMKKYDYICVPKELEGKTDCISSIFITPRYYCITFTIDNKKTDFYCYFSDDKKGYSYDYSEFAIKYGAKDIIGNTCIYKYNNKFYYKYNDCFFAVDSNYNFDRSVDERVTKIYTDDHFVEKDGNLYFINDNNRKENGWKKINGHKYFFRSSDKTAIRGKGVEINDIVYSFSSNGICEGEYTGWATESGKLYYYKNGIMKKNCWLTANGKKKYFLTKDGSAALGKVTVSGVEYDFDENGQLIPDEWGITLTASNVTPTGMNIEYLWDGTKITGEIQFGASYHLEQYKNGKWEKLPTVNDDIIAFIAISYSLTESEPVFVQTQEWSRLYGSLESGNYRFCTDILDFRGAGDYDSKTYYAYFKI